MHYAQAWAIGAPANSDAWLAEVVLRLNRPHRGLLGEPYQTLAAQVNHCCDCSTDVSFGGDKASDLDCENHEVVRGYYRQGKRTLSNYSRSKLGFFQGQSCSLRLGFAPGLGPT